MQEQNCKLHAVNLNRVDRIYLELYVPDGDSVTQKQKSIRPAEGFRIAEEVWDYLSGDLKDIEVVISTPHTRSVNAIRAPRQSVVAIKNLKKPTPLLRNLYEKIDTKITEHQEPKLPAKPKRMKLPAKINENPGNAEFTWEMIVAKMQLAKARIVKPAPPQFWINLQKKIDKNPETSQYIWCAKDHIKVTIPEVVMENIWDFATKIVDVKGCESNFSKNRTPEQAVQNHAAGKAAEFAVYFFLGCFNRACQLGADVVMPSIEVYQGSDPGDFRFDGKNIDVKWKTDHTRAAIKDIKKDCIGIVCTGHPAKKGMAHNVEIKTVIVDGIKKNILDYLQSIISKKI